MTKRRVSMLALVGVLTLSLMIGGRLFAESAETVAGQPDKKNGAVATQPASSDSKEIEFHFVTKPGQTQRLRIVTRSFGLMRLGGPPIPPQKFSQWAEQELATRCVEVLPDGTTRIEMMLPNAAFQMNYGGTKIAIDTRKPAESDNPSTQAMRELFVAMSKIKCNIILSSRGEPIKVQGFSQGVEEAIAEIDFFSSKPFIKPIVNQMQKCLGDNIIEEQLRTFFRLLPDRGKARIGDRWTHEWQVPLPIGHMIAVGKGEYELVGIERFRGRDCAKIKIRSSLTTTTKPANDSAGTAATHSSGDASDGLMAQMKFSLAASGGSGIAYVDYATGTLMQLQQTDRITIEMSLDADPGALREGIRYTAQEMTTSLHMELLEEDGKEIAPAAPHASVGTTKEVGEQKDTATTQPVKP